MPPSKQTGLTGWLSTKKSDAQIQRDAEMAQTLRKEKFGRKKSTNGKKKPASKTTATMRKSGSTQRGRNRRHDDDSESEFDGYGDESEDDMDDFVVDDDDDISVEVDSDSEDSLMHRKTTRNRSNAQIAPTGRRKAAAAATKKNSTYSDDGNIEDDDDEDEVVDLASDSDSDNSDVGFMDKWHKDKVPRDSKPSKALQRTKQAGRPNPGLVKPDKLMVPAKKVQHRKRPPNVNRSGPMKSVPATASKYKGYSSSENLTSPSPVKNSKPPIAKKRNGMNWIEAAMAEPSASDSDSETPAKATTSKFFQRKTKTVGDGSEEDDLTPIKPKSKTQPLGRQKVGKSASSNTRLTESSDDSPEKSEVKKVSGVMDSLGRAGVKRNSSYLSDSSSEDDVDTKKRKSFQRKEIKPKQNPVNLLGDSDEEDADFKEAINRSLSLENKVVSLDDTDEDEDGVAALDMAMKASKKTFKKEKAKKKQPVVVDLDADDGGEKPILIDAMDAPSSEEDDDDNNEADAYAEDMEKAASSVLETAEKLSSQVLQSMIRWMREKDGSETTVPQGMIVDGALAMSSLEAAKTDDEVKIEDENKSGSQPEGGKSKHAWISQEEMRTVCPSVILSEYQLVGVNWMALLHGMQCNIDNRNTNVNGVLADEMGLGKTVQTIAFLAWLKYRKDTVSIDYMDEDVAVVEPTRPHLIVVPVSVLSNWMREFETFCPDLNVVKYHGSQEERMQLRDELRYHVNPKKPVTPSLDVIVAPITYFQAEKSDDRSFLRRFKYDYLVVDEAHNLRNAQSTRYRNLNMVSSSHRLLLTGTPIQNSPQELMNMLCFLMPLFSSKANKFEDDSGGGSDHMLQYFVELEGGGTTNEECAYKKLKKLFAPFVLRRKKDDVLSQVIPPKKRKVVFVELDDTARKTYDSILAAHVNKSGQKLTGAIGDHLFTNLRKAAHHPLLLRNRHTADHELDHLVTQFQRYGAFKGGTRKQVMDEVKQMCDFTIHVHASQLIDENRHRYDDLKRYILNEEDLFSSAKFTKLRTMVPQLIKEGHRILIFSVWTSCLDLLGCLVEHLGLDFLRMDGSCPSALRQEMIDRFNNDSRYSVFLLSTNACGIGINLTAADTCIIHDIDFNPFNDLQAEDRCHRIGQKKEVTVIKMVTKDTVDSDIYDMQERKAKMNAAIMESNYKQSVASDRKEMLQTAMNRFMSTPSKDRNNNSKNVPGQNIRSINKENVTQEVIDLDD